MRSYPVAQTIVDKGSPERAYRITFYPYGKIIIEFLDEKEAR